MKTKKGFVHALIYLLILIMVVPLSGFAQDQATARQFNQEELDQMLAPIALYPDSLLAQILMAATYPLEVVQADRWVRANRNLTGDQLNNALDQQDWDPSVKALMPFQQVLSMMDERLEWTQKLGDAFLDQQDEVMDTIQQLRARAQAAGNLRDTEEQNVTEEDGEIEIEPAQPDVVYVPVYDPTVIYGPWWYPDFLPFFFLPPPGVVIGFHGRMGFGRGIGVGRSWGYAWGHWDWRNHHLNVNTDRHININRNIDIAAPNIQTTQWQHDANHRKGISYRSEATRQRYGQSPKGVETRRDFRGFEPQTRYEQAPVTTGQSFEQRGGPGGSVQKSPDLSKNKSAFGGVGQGSDARTQSNRGFQSRQSTPSRGTGGVSRGNVGQRR
jgi:hypothetical protein